MELTSTQKGGIQAAKNLSSEDRTERALRASEARWGQAVQVVDPKYMGKINLGDQEVECAVTENGARLLFQKQIQTLLGRHSKEERSAEGRPPFLAASNLQQYITPELETKLVPISFRLRGKSNRYLGYHAELLPEVCEIYLKARDNQVLVVNQVPTMQQAEKLMRALAKVGIVSLVDEATGYQKVRERNELKNLLEKYVAEEFRPWTKRFPDVYYDEISRLYGWKNNPNSTERTPAFANLTNKLIYARLPPGVKEELNRRNPSEFNGYAYTRKLKNHQLLTDDVGIEDLRNRITTAVTLMKVSETKEGFEALFNKRYRQKIF